MTRTAEPDISVQICDPSAGSGGTWLDVQAKSFRCFRATAQGGPPREVSPIKFIDLVRFLYETDFSKIDKPSVWRSWLEQQPWPGWPPRPCCKQPRVELPISTKAARKLHTWFRRHAGLLLAGFRMVAHAEIENGVIVNFRIQLLLSRILTALMVEEQRSLLRLRTLIRKLQDGLPPPPWCEAGVLFRVQRRSDIGILVDMALRKPCPTSYEDARWTRTTFRTTPMTA